MKENEWRCYSSAALSTTSLNSRRSLVLLRQHNDNVMRLKTSRSINWVECNLWSCQNSLRNEYRRLYSEQICLMLAKEEWICDVLFECECAKIERAVLIMNLFYINIRNHKKHNCKFIQATTNKMTLHCHFKSNTLSDNDLFHSIILFINILTMAQLVHLTEECGALSLRSLNDSLVMYLEVLSTE